MQYRNLGSSGLRVSTLSFGSWVTFGTQMNSDPAYECMKAAYDAGVNFFDNAEAYADGQSEEIMGQVLKRAGWARKDLVIATKLFWGGKGVNDRGLSRKHIIEGLNASLKRMQLEYVDLLFCHRPDLHTPIEETVRAMNHVINQGKAFYWGTSEWSGQQIREAHAIARREHLIGPTMEQPQYHMFHRDRVEEEYKGLYEQFGMGTTTWSPLASGLLTGKYNDGTIPDGARAGLPGYEWLKKKLVGDAVQDKVAKVKELTKVAQELGGTMSQLAIAWCANNPHVSTVITGASRPAQVVENMKSLELLPKLTPEFLARINSILDNTPAQEMDWRKN